MKYKIYPLSIDNHLLYGIGPHFCKNILISPPMVFQKSQHPINKEGSHYGEGMCERVCSKRVYRYLRAITKIN